MRTRKRLLLLGGAVLAAVLAWGAWELLRPHPPRFTMDLTFRIRPGMTEAEVVAILGKPAGNYASPGALGGVGCWEDRYWDDKRTAEVGSYTKGWISDAGAIWVRFGPDGRVYTKSWNRVGFPRGPETPWGRIYRWARRLFG
jgi:hypothetical protein